MNNSKTPKAPPLVTKARGSSGGVGRGPSKLHKLSTGNHGTPDLPNSRIVLPKIKTTIERYDDLLEGSLSNLLPKLPSEVRIFLSSTFSDYRSERNWLTRESFGELQEFCANIDLDFRVVDMRWGVTDDATNEHITEKLCTAEIATCKRLSIGPNFVAMLGDRYGYQPLPYAFVAKEFEILHKEAVELNHPRADILHQWYSLDDNNEPPIYCIKPIKENIPHFGDHSAGMEEARVEAAATWGKMLVTIHDVFRSAVTSLADKKIITAARRHDFFKSVTEMEVVDGILEAHNPREHALCYLRSFNGLDESRLTDKDALRNIDGHMVDGKVEINKEAVRFQSTLKQGAIPTHLKATNIRRYTVTWEEGGINPDEHQEHKQYLAKFCREFVLDVKHLIEGAMQNQQNMIPQSEYYTGFEEALHHSHFCVSKCLTFRGQEKPLGQIREFLKTPNKQQAPLVVYAESGVGKTSILAMAMKCIPKWFSPESIRIIRFLGTSPESRMISDVLYGVMGQLADIFDMIIEPVSVKSFKAMVESLPRFLRNISRKSNHPIFIFLDSIDQLATDDDAFSMRWFPKEFPTNIYFILSTLPRYENILENIRKVINPPERCFIEVQPLPIETGKDIIKSYLKAKGRKVTSEQEKLLLNCLQNEPSPLFLKLFLDKALSWRSVTPVDAIRVEASVRVAISHLFEDLEAKFGSCLIQRALGYITVGMDGLSELEIEDVLSCDDTVLNEVYIYHDPPVRGVIRVPPLLWARVRIHINEYLTERRSYTKTTLYWYHRQFIEVASEMYTSNDNGKILHRRLAELYLSEYGVKKDITLTKRRNLKLPKADRQVTSQPMISRNQRMLQALPYHLRHAQNVRYLKQVALCNLRFLMTRMAGFSVNAIIKDIDASLELFGGEPDPELQILFNTLKAAKGSLHTSSQLPLQLLTRLKHDQKGSPHISNLLDKAREYLENSTKPELLPLFPCLVNTSEKVWSASDAAICSVSKDKTRVVLTTTERDQQTEKLSIKIVVIDVVALRVILEEMIMVEMSPHPCITRDGKKLINVQICDSAMLSKQNKVKKNPGVKGASDPPKIGEYVVKIVDLDAVIAGKESCTKYLRLSKLKISKVHMSSATSDGTKLCVVYNTSQFAICEVKTDEIVVSCQSQIEKDSFGDISEIQWFGKNNCFIFMADMSGHHGVFIITNSSGKAGTNIKLPGKLRKESTLWLPSSQQVVCSCATDENYDVVVVIDARSSIILETIDLPKGQVMLHHSSGQESLLVSTESQMYMMSKGDRSSLKEYSVEPAKDAPHDVMCAAEDVDTGLIVFGDNTGTLHAYKKNDTGLIGAGQAKLSEGPLRKLYLNEAEEVLISEDSFEIIFWNWPLVKQKCLTPKMSPSKGSDSTGLLLCDYQSAGSIIFSPDAKHIITVSPVDGVKTWNLENQQKENLYGKAVNPKTTYLVCEGSVLVTLDSNEKKIYAWETANGTELDALKYLHGSILAIAKNSKSDDVYVMADVEGKYCLTVIDMTKRKITKTIPLLQTLDSSNIEIALSESEHYLYIKVHATPIQLKILLASEKKSNLSHSEGKYLFYAINLEEISGELIVCKRQLTSVPALGESWLVHNDSTLIIGRSRITVVWDVESGSTDQRMIKGKKVAQFYRPEWVEDDETYMKLCSGQINCMVKSDNRQVVGIGSGDGWVLMFNANTGARIGGHVKKKKRASHHGQVKKLALSSDGVWAASFASDRTLKFWAVTDTESGQEVASMKLILDVHQMTFTPDGLTLGVQGVNDVGSSSVLVFKVVGNIGNRGSILAAGSM